MAGNGIDPGSHSPHWSGQMRAKVRTGFSFVSHELRLVIASIEMNLGEKDVATPMKSLQGVVLFVCSLFPVLTAAQDLPGVQLETVSSEDIVQEVTLNGTVNALRVSGMSAAVAGLLDEVRVETGDRVARGDVLVELDDELVTWELAAARAEAEEARSRLEEARRRLREARSVGAGRNIAATEVSARESEVAASEATLARLEAARRQLARCRPRSPRSRSRWRGAANQRLRIWAWRCLATWSSWSLARTRYSPNVPSNTVHYLVACIRTHEYRTIIQSKGTYINERIESTGTGYTGTALQTPLLWALLHVQLMY